MQSRSHLQHFMTEEMEMHQLNYFTSSAESACNVGDRGSIPGSRRSPGEGNGNPLQYSCLENPHGQRSLAGYSPWGREESDTTGRLHVHIQDELGQKSGPNLLPLATYSKLPILTIG